MEGSVEFSGKSRDMPVDGWEMPTDSMCKMPYCARRREGEGAVRVSTERGGRGNHLLPDQNRWPLRLIKLRTCDSVGWPIGDSDHILNVEMGLFRGFIQAPLEQRERSLGALPHARYLPNLTLRARIGSVAVRELHMALPSRSNYYLGRQERRVSSRACVPWRKPH
ncbi:hypothetical protein LZ32DRAFT_607860 [Colletotrichum eremochloae]|nr:hypothetical protein LZ32DRAFT_607860 [Colletotrichum eremochloae]